MRPLFVQLISADHMGTVHIFRRSMYGICTYIYRKNQPHVGKYAIHGASGHNFLFSAMIFQVTPMVAMVHGSKGDEHQCYVNENTGDAKPVGSPVVM